MRERIQPALVILVALALAVLSGPVAAGIGGTFGLVVGVVMLIVAALTIVNEL